VQLLDMNTDAASSATVAVPVTSPVAPASP
jgi:hypothetical protein